MATTVEVPGEAPGRSRVAALRPAARAADKQWYRFSAAAGAEEATLYLYADIGGWLGAQADYFVADLNQITAPTLHVRINSRGGDVFEGLTIYNALVRHASYVIVHIDGIAASIASVVAMAGDEIRMGDGTFLMIHDPYVCTCGTANELREAADVLDKVEVSLAGIYAKRSGMPLDEVETAMEVETWYTADEARAAGLADAEDEEPPALPAAALDLSIFNHVPAPLAARAKPTKQAREFATVREFEAFLRDEGGLSHAAARAIAASGYTKSPEPRDEDGGLSELVAALRARGASIATL